MKSFERYGSTVLPGWLAGISAGGLDDGNVEGHLLTDHVHMCMEIPPKHAVASIIGFLKGKSAVAIARQFGGKQQNFTGAHFWARGYAVSTVGYELEEVKRYIREQEAEDQAGRF